MAEVCGCPAGSELVVHDIARIVTPIVTPAMPNALQGTQTLGFVPWLPCLHSRGLVVNSGPGMGIGNYS